MEEAVKERENLYKLIISQLRYDGCEAIASNLAKTTNIISPCPPSARLHQVVNLGLRAETEGARPENATLPGLTNNIGPAVTKGIDLEYEPEEYNNYRRNGQAPEPPLGHHDLRKPTSSSDSGGESDRENVPPKEVQEHILRITKSKIAADEINVVRSNGETTLTNEALSTDNICLRVKQELQKMNISQEVFAKCVLGKTQGYLSEMLKHGEKVFYSREKANSKGRMNFEKMRQFLLKPEEERRVIYADKARQLREERLSRKRLSFTMAYSSPLVTADDIKPLNKLKCYSHSHDDTAYSRSHEDSAYPSSHDNSASYMPPERPTIHSQPRHIVSPHHPSNAYRNNLTIKTELVSPPRARSGYEHSTVIAPRHLDIKLPRDHCDRVLFMREETLPRVSDGGASYCVHKKEPIIDDVHSDKHLVTTKIAALSRKQVTPVKIRKEPVEKEPVTRYITVGVPRRKSESEDSSYGIPDDVVTIETLPLQSLAADDMDSNDEHPEPLVIRRHCYDDSNVEIGENMYVVQVDRTDAIRVTSSI